MDAPVPLSQTKSRFAECTCHRVMASNVLSGTTSNLMRFNWCIKFESQGLQTPVLNGLWSKGDNHNREFYSPENWLHRIFSSLNGSLDLTEKLKRKE